MKISTNSTSICLESCPHCSKRNVYYIPHDSNYGLDINGLVCWNCKKQFYLYEMGYLEESHFEDGVSLKSLITILDVK